jgi:peptidoglycan/xylan/chitin deacetylase (PgdA/CDA1 family)
LGVTPDHFAEQLDVLQRTCRPIPLQQLVRQLRERNLPPRAVALTLDNGYADNLLNAKPLLEQHDVPATGFVTTGYLSKHREFWWDELERLLLQAGTLPSELRLRLNGTIWSWQPGDAAHYDAAAAERRGCWRAWE